MVSKGAYYFVGDFSVAWESQHSQIQHWVWIWVVYEPYTDSTAKQILSSQIKYLLHVSINPAQDHCLVLHFALKKRVIVVYDGLERALQTWIDEAEMVLRIYSLITEKNEGRKNGIAPGEQVGGIWFRALIMLSNVMDTPVVP